MSAKKEKFIIYTIGDYGDDLAFNEVTTRIEQHFYGHDIAIHKQKVEAFSTVETGFTLAQLALNVPETPKGLREHAKFFVNTAPRKDDPLIRVKNQGEALVYFKLYNGVEGVAVNSGWSLSFIKDAAVEIRAMSVDDAGSQFRSRDIFPQAFAEAVLGGKKNLGRDIRDEIPDFPENHVAYTDGYGNLKCSIDPDKINEHLGKHVKVYVNRATLFATVSQGIFGVEEGEFCVSVGSSGWELPDGTRKRFVEIVRRGGSAAEAADKPHSGKKLTWKIVE